MSTYHKWRTVFVQIPKNASTSIHSVLSNPTDCDNHEHELYIETLSKNDPELIESYFSFACVRNPYDRFVSNFEYYRDPDHDYRWSVEFEDVVKMFYERGRFFYTTENRHWWPQARFIAIKKNILVDKIIRFETLDEEWSEIVDEIKNNIPEGFSTPARSMCKSNITRHREGRHWEEYYTPETKKMVYELYKRDFEMFNYEK